MRALRIAVLSALLTAACNCRLAVYALGLTGGAAVGLYVLAGVAFALCLVCPAPGRHLNKRLRGLDGGGALMIAFFCMEAVSAGLLIWAVTQAVAHNLAATALIAHCVIVFLSGAALLLGGAARVFGTSVQLGIARRVLLLVFWWVPVLNCVLVAKACYLAEGELKFETEKLLLDEARKESALCKTRYPIVLVHGVFFRDSRLLNYWGRIPAALIRNGATICYGEQQSAASVVDSARELAVRIKSIALQTQEGKVNLIAHSKGGLDARYAISVLGTDQYVASLTTINTPHQGCLFADYLLERLPAALKNKLASTYNATLRKLGDTNPDFLAAVQDLTHMRCEALNAQAPDRAGVLYESVGSKVTKAKSGQFPLNVSYPLVKHHDGENDGLVALESAKWGTSFTPLIPKGRRGISHADVIDLSRENIRGFDVREFYVNLVNRLKERGY